MVLPTAKFSGGDESVAVVAAILERPGWVGQDPHVVVTVVAEPGAYGVARFGTPLLETTPHPRRSYYGLAPPLWAPV